MQIESIIRRKNGTRVSIAGVTYTFTSTADDPRQIVDVTDNAAIQKLLAVKEGYRIADPVRTAVVSDAVKAETIVSAALSSAAAQLKQANPAVPQPKQPAAAQLKQANPAVPQPKQPAAATKK